MASLRTSLFAPNVRRALSRHPPFLLYGRRFATQNKTTSKLLSQQLDRVGGKDASNSGGLGSVGPFPLGVTPLNIRGSREPPVKPWDQLTPGGKVLRTTARASNLTVILIGATLSVVLTYALATELFAKNSPTVLYGDACDRIKGSEALKAYLPGTLSFHTTPPSLVPTRHRNRHPQSHLAADAHGVEHLLLHFWVTSSHLTDAQRPEQSWSEWFQDEWDLEWNWERLKDSGNYFKGKAVEAWDSAKQTAAFVSGMPIQSTSTQVPTLATTTTRQSFELGGPESSGRGFFGLFKNLKGRSGLNPSTSGAAAMNTQWDTAEVHVDLVKDAAGIFRYRYLVVDLPNSRVSRPIRITIERGPTFSEREGIFVTQ